MCVSQFVSLPCVLHHSSLQYACHPFIQVLMACAQYVAYHHPVHIGHSFQWMSTICKPVSFYLTVRLQPISHVYDRSMMVADEHRSW